MHLTTGLHGCLETKLPWTYEIALCFNTVHGLLIMIRQTGWKETMKGSFHIKSTQKRDISNPTPSELNNFCDIVVPIEISIPAKFYCFMATRFLRADIQSCQKNSLFGHKLLKKKRHNLCPN
jgi:hypothetical protein